MPYCMLLIVVKSSKLSPVFFWHLLNHQQAHVQRYIFLFFISVMCTSCIRCRRRWVSIYPRNDHKVLLVEFLESDHLNHLSNIQKDVCLSILCLCYLSHRNLNSCRRIIYLGKKHDRSVKGKRRNVRKWFFYSTHAPRKKDSDLFFLISGASAPLNIVFILSRISGTSCIPLKVFFWAVCVQHDETSSGQCPWGTLWWMHSSTVYPTCGFSPKYWGQLKSMVKCFGNFPLGNASDSSPACSSVC